MSQKYITVHVDYCNYCACQTRVVPPSRLNQVVWGPRPTPSQKFCSGSGVRAAHPAVGWQIIATETRVSPQLSGCTLTDPTQTTLTNQSSADWKQTGIVPLWVFFVLNSLHPLHLPVCSSLQLSPEVIYLSIHPSIYLCPKKLQMLYDSISQTFLFLVGI